MANYLYDPARASFLDGSINWMTGTIKVSLLTTGYTFSSAHQYFSSVPSGSVFRTSGALTGKATTNGYAAAADVSFTSVTPGVQITALVVYQTSAASGGADLSLGAQRLIAHVDTLSSPGVTFPYTTTGNPLVLRFTTGLFRV